jgi:hypothetical protein
LKILSLLVPALFLWVPFSSVAAQEPSPTPASTPAVFSPEHPKGYLGVGIGTTPLGATALALRYWMEDNTALDVMVSGSDSPGAGYDFSGNQITTSNWAYGLSLGLKQNLKEPIRDVFVQGIARLSYAQNFVQSTSTTSENSITYGYTNLNTQNQEVSLFLGIGFEAFVPFWEDISIEGNAGLSVNALWNEVTDYYNPNFSSQPDISTSYGLLSAGVNTNTFSILSGSVHFYF